MAGPQEFFKGRKPVKFTEPTPPPPEMVRLEMTMQEYRVIREAAYFYWASFSSEEGSVQPLYWNNATTRSYSLVSELSDEQCAKLAQDFYDYYKPNA